MQAPAFRGFRITELGFVTAEPDGRLYEGSGLVGLDGSSMKKEVEQLTGITRAELKGKPHWGLTWAEPMARMARRHLSVGFNSLSFDVPAVIKMNRKYGRRGTRFRFHIDLKRLPQVTGNLARVAQVFGVQQQGAHRALPDAWTTARVLDKVLQVSGRAAVSKSAKLEDYRPPPEDGPWARRERLARIIAAGALDLDRFASDNAISKRSAEEDLSALIAAGHYGPELVLDDKSLERIKAELPAALNGAWIGTERGRLKPLRSWLTRERALPLSYPQLRAILRSEGYEPEQSQDGRRWRRPGSLF